MAKQIMAEAKVEVAYGAAKCCKGEFRLDGWVQEVNTVYSIQFTVILCTVVSLVRNKGVDNFLQITGRDKRLDFGSCP